MASSLQCFTLKQLENWKLIAVCSGFAVQKNKLEGDGQVYWTAKDPNSETTPAQGHFYEGLGGNLFFDRCFSLVEQEQTPSSAQIGRTQ